MGTEITRRQAIRNSLGVTGLVSALMGSAKLFGADACIDTAPQTEGPFYPIAAQPDTDVDLTQIKGNPKKALGQVVVINGTVVDEDCKPIPHALVEIWQAAASGRYNHPGDTSGLPLDPNFQYWGRMAADANGKYQFRTIIPGHYPAGGNWYRPPHIHYKAAARGFHDLTTQMYFDPSSFDAEKAKIVADLNRKDAILRAVPAHQRAAVVVAFKQTSEVGVLAGTFDIVLKKVRI